MSIALALQIIQGLMALMIQAPQIISAAQQIIDEIENWHDGADETSQDLILQITKARKAVSGGKA